MKSTKSPEPRRGLRKPSNNRNVRGQALPADEVEFRIFAAAAGTAIVVLMGLVAVLVSQMP